MNKHQTAQALSILKEAYPAFYREQTMEDAERTIALWTEMFAGDDPSVVTRALKDFIVNDAKGFPPHIGAIKDIVRRMSAPKHLTADEAWNNIWKTVREKKWNFRDAFNALPAIERIIIGDSQRLSIWGELDMRTLESRIAPDFKRSYREAVKEKEHYDVLPQDVKAFYRSMGKVPYDDKDAPREIPSPRKTVRLVERDGTTVALVIKRG